MLEALDWMILQLERFNPGLHLAVSREEALLGRLNHEQQAPVTCYELRLPSPVLRIGCVMMPPILSQSFEARPVSSAECA